MAARSAVLLARRAGPARLIAESAHHQRCDGRRQPAATALAGEAPIRLVSAGQPQHGRATIPTQPLYQRCPPHSPGARAGALGGAARTPGPCEGTRQCWPPAAFRHATSATAASPAAPARLLADRYTALLASGTLQPDARQASTVEALQGLLDRLAEYRQQVDEHNVQREAYERTVAARLAELEAAEASRRGGADASGDEDPRAGMLRRLREAVGLAEARSELSPAQVAAMTARRLERQAVREAGLPPQPPQPPRGFYIYGSVGSGKSLLMDMFYSAAERSAGLPFLRRVHFNAAMLELHSWMNQLETASRSGGLLEDDVEALEGYSQEAAYGQLAKARDGRNAVIALRRAIRAAALNPNQQRERLARSNASVIRGAARALIRGKLDPSMANGRESARPLLPSLLCFDELQVTDPFAAAVLKGLLEVLVDEGTVVVMTSNRAPWELNSQGLNEDLFEHFVDSLQRSTAPLEIASGTDYRKSMYSAQTKAELQLFHSPLSDATSAAIDRLWNDLTSSSAPTEVQVMFGRSLAVPQACTSGVARFRFPELCARPLGAADYIALSRRFHTVFVTDIPAFSMQIRDQARRFITLVDELYNHRVRLVCSAADTPDQLFLHTEGNEEAILSFMDLESLQSETATEGGGLRRDVLAKGGVTTVATTQRGMMAATQMLGGMEEKFAFARAVSRMYEMQTDVYLRTRARSAA